MLVLAIVCCTVFFFIGYFFGWKRAELSYKPCQSCGTIRFPRELIGDAEYWSCVDVDGCKARTRV